MSILVTSLALKLKGLSHILAYMAYFEIRGGKRLKGSIRVRGSKNAATPILAASLLTKDPVIIDNLPLIEDVFRMLEIMESLGTRIEWLGKRRIRLQTKKIDFGKINEEAVKKLRSSILLLGSLSARLERFRIYQPGGCIIGARPVETHLEALRKLGIKIKPTNGGYAIDARGRRCAKVVLKEFSVTATENAMMLAAAMPGKTVIKIAAAEPHVEDLGRFLTAMGAEIKGLGTHTLEIRGRQKLHGVEHKIIPDANEAATFLIMGVATRSPIKVVEAIEDHLDLVLEKLRQFGADFKIGGNYIQVIPPKKINAVAKIDTRTYPGIPTDIQAPFGVLATQAEGETVIFDTLFEGRFNYLSELEKMRARVKTLNPHQAVISGPLRLQGCEIRSFDLRAGASLIIAALLAEGRTVIQDIYQVDRGYENIEERLQNIGADIRRISN